MWLILITTTLLLFLLTILYEESPAFRYKFKFALYVVYVSTSVLFTIPLYLFKMKDVRNVQWTAPLIRRASPLLGIHWNVINAGNLDVNGPCVFICNHQSILDILGMAEIWPYIKNCATVAKREIMWVFPFGFGAWLCGTLFIDRKSKEARGQVVKEAEELKARGDKLWIFPEGTRFKGSTLKPFKKGAFHIAQSLKIPIVPVVISPYTFINDEKFTFGSGKMLISVLPPIPTEGLSESDVNDLVEKTRDRMTTEYQRIGEVLYKQRRGGNLKNGSCHSPVTFGGK